MQQLEHRGGYIVDQLFGALIDEPKTRIPKNSWNDLAVDESCYRRRVCDYIAGMTDRYAERIYRRLFIPGYGSSRDEL